MLLKLGTFGLALFGLAMRVLAETFRKDEADKSRNLSPIDVAWSGPARWKTVANVMFLAAVTMFFPAEFMDSIVNQFGMQFGAGGAILFGFISEHVMNMLMRKYRAKQNGKESQAE